MPAAEGHGLYKYKREVGVESPAVLLGFFAGAEDVVGYHTLGSALAEDDVGVVLVPEDVGDDAL